MGQLMQEKFAVTVYDERDIHMTFHAPCNLLIRIGSLKSSQIKIKDAALMHAVIELDDESKKATLIDWGSSMRTRVNRNEVSISSPVYPGDIIEIGGKDIKVVRVFGKSANIEPSEVDDEDVPDHDEDEMAFVASWMAEWGWKNGYDCAYAESDDAHRDSINSKRVEKEDVINKCSNEIEVARKAFQICKEKWMKK